MMKTCPSCGQTKSEAEFGRNRSLKDGLSFNCLDCNRQHNRARYRESRRALGLEVRDYSWIPEGFRWCPSCQQPVAIEDFVRSAATASGFGSRCRPCDRAAKSEAYFYRKYKMTKKELAALRAAQNDACAICDDPGPEHLDHDHESGVTRALLCQRCNQGLGLLRDSAAILRAAADYVEVHRARQVAPFSGSPSANRPVTLSRPGTPPVGSGRHRCPRHVPAHRLCSRGLLALAIEAEAREAAAREADG
jgi:Recombination endonuclease VII